MNKYLVQYLKSDYDLIQKIFFAAGMVGFVGHLVFYVVLAYLFGFNDLFSVRLIASVLSLGFIYLHKQKKLNLYHKLYYEIITSFSIPVLFNVMLILNEFNLYWNASLIFAGMIFGAVIKPVRALILWPLSYLCSLLILKGVYSVDISPELIVASFQINVVAYFMVIIIGIVQVIINYSFLEIKMLNNSKEKIFGVIAHDLRNLLNVLIISNELLADKISDHTDKRIVELVSNMSDSLAHSSRLLENLLEWSSVNTGMHKPYYQAFKPSDILDDVIKMFEHIAVTKNIEIATEKRSDSKIYADHQMVTTVMRNLINNAIKFTRRDGRIIVKYEKYNDQMLFTVSDTGVGIRSENIEKLFKAGLKRSTSGTEKEAGTGIGLLLSRDFVELHGGKIWAESEEGKGSDFMFTLPLSE